MTKRKKKLLTIQILLFSLATILIFFTYYGKNDNKFDNKKTKTETKPIEKDADDKTTSFENIEYKGVDLEGNR